jgi:putative phosphoribosyl transferase
MREFSTRTAAGRALAEAVAARGWADPVVLALPRGGVPVALEVARALSAPLDLVVVRKIGVPRQPELAAAAVVDGEAPHIVYNRQIMAATGLRDADIAELARKQLVEIERRRARYLAGRPRVPVAGRTAIVIDDGIATGATMRASLQAVRARSPARTVLAVPVAPPQAVAALRAEADEVVCLGTPSRFSAIGAHYDDFHQVGDDEVVAMLAESQTFTRE